MMEAQSAFQLAFDFLTSKPVVVEPSAAQVSSDAELLPFRQLDEQLGLTEQVAGCLTDPRHGGYVGHTFLEMVRMRVYGILADYANQNDHGLLRSDPVFKLICGRSIHGADLASQPTDSRRCHGLRTPSVRVRSFVFASCWSTSSSPRLTLRPSDSRWILIRSMIRRTASSN
jgi:hypothetical protein